MNLLEVLEVLGPSRQSLRGAERVLLVVVAHPMPPGILDTLCFLEGVA